MIKKITSLCIPRIEVETTKEYIFKTFQNLKLGYIKNIKEIPLKNDKKHKRIIITIELNENPLSLNIISKLNNNETIKIVYDMPDYWKVVTTKY